MKKILTAVLVLLTTLSFSQVYQFEKINHYGIDEDGNKFPFLIKTPSEFDKTALLDRPTLSKVITSPFDNLTYGGFIAIIKFYLF